MYCKNCGKKLLDDQKYCDNCGHNMSDSSTNENQAAINTRRKQSNGIRCFVPECNESVIGQCPGLPNQPCGHFYCSQHSRGKICDECAAVVEQERVYQHYLEKAKWVSQESILSKTGIAGVVVSSLLLMLRALPPSWILIIIVSC